MSPDNAQFDQQMRLRVYDDFLRHGEAPTSDYLARVLKAPISEVRSSLARLAAARSLVLQENGEVLMANPLSAVPTGFVVRIADRSWFANCIWDGLGLIAMLGGFGEVATSCGCCGGSMHVEVQHGRLGIPEGAVAHFAIPARKWWDDIVFN